MIGSRRRRFRHQPQLQLSVRIGRPEDARGDLVRPSGRSRHGIEEARVAVVPGEAFGAPGYARLSFALGDDALVEGVERIAKFLR